MRLCPGDARFDHPDLGLRSFSEVKVGTGRDALLRDQVSPMAVHVARLPLSPSISRRWTLTAEKYGRSPGDEAEFEIERLP